jgi:hypothetical protein
VLAGLILGAIQAQLSSATIRIELAPSSAKVQAQYRFRALPDSGASFVLLRIPGQSIEGLETPNGAAVSMPTLTRVRGVLDPSGNLSIRFRVTGALERIPVPVPAVTADGRSKPVEIRLTGDVTTVDLAEAFPRLGPDEDGGHTARLANVPSLVQLPPRGAWRVLRILDWTVVVLVGASAVGWVMSRRVSP